MVMLVGVQSNQFPRALDLAKSFPQTEYQNGNRRFSRFGNDGDAQRT